MDNREEIQQAHFGHVYDKQIVAKDAVNGKTISIEKGVQFDMMVPAILINFVDGTHAIYKVRTDYDGDVEIEFSEQPLAPMSMVYFNLITNEEYSTYNRDYKSRRDKNLHDRRHNLYLELKEEFEDE